MEWPKISIKWKIFHWCLSLAIGILAFNYWYTNKLVRRSAGHMTQELQSTFTRYQSFERAIANGMAAATDVWGRSPRLENALAAGNDEAAKPVLDEVQRSLAQTHPPRLRPHRRPSRRRHRGRRHRRRGGADHARGQRPAPGHEHRRRAARRARPRLPHRRRAGAARRRRGGRAAHRRAPRARVRRLHAGHRRRSEEAGGAGAHPQLAHHRRLGAHRRLERPGARRPARGAPARRRRRARRWRWSSCPTASTTSSRRSSTATTGAAQGFIGSLFILRNRVERTQRMHGIIRDNLIMASVALAFAAAIAFAISLHRHPADPPVHRRHRRARPRRGRRVAPARRAQARRQGDARARRQLERAVRQAAEPGGRGAGRVVPGGRVVGGDLGGVEADARRAPRTRPRASSRRRRR